MIKLKDIPRSLLIGENFWAIRFVHQCPGEPESTLGVCDPAEHVVYIRMGQSPKERLKTLIHEFCHVICYEFDIPENHSVIHSLEEPIYLLLGEVFSACA